MSYHVKDAERIPPPVPPPDGFFCPRCPPAEPEPLFVADTVSSAPGLVTRYRRCKKCGHSEITWEQKRPTTAPLKLR